MSTRVKVNNSVTDADTAGMLQRAGIRAGIDLVSRVTQGSWSYKVAASGTTHRGAGVVDISTRNLSTTEIFRVAAALMAEGGMPFIRRAGEVQAGNIAHIHLVNPRAGAELDPVAAIQVGNWKNNNNGLRGGGKLYLPPSDILAQFGVTNPYAPIGSDDNIAKDVGVGVSGAIAGTTSLVTWFDDVNNWRRLVFAIVGLIFIIVSLTRLTGI